MYSARATCAGKGSPVTAQGSGRGRVGNTLSAFAKLASQHQRASTRKKGMSRQAQSLLQVRRTGRLHDVPLEATGRVAPSITSQVMYNTLWALAKLNMPPAGSLRDRRYA
jgi:hypothetical protein